MERIHAGLESRDQVAPFAPGELEVSALEQDEGLVRGLRALIGRPV